MGTVYAEVERRSSVWAEAVREPRHWRWTYRRLATGETDATEARITDRV